MDKLEIMEQIKSKLKANYPHANDAELGLWTDALFKEGTRRAEEPPTSHDHHVSTS